LKIETITVDKEIQEKMDKVAKVWKNKKNKND